MKTRIMAWASAALMFALLVSLFFNYKQYRDAMQPPEVIAVDTSVEWRETSSASPQSVSEREVGTLSVPVKKKPQTANFQKISPTARDTLSPGKPPDAAESDTLSLPLTQKMYADSGYVAYVSGYMPRLDSIRIRYPVVTTTIEKQRQRQHSRLHLGIVGGYGYGFNSRKVEPFIGLGLSWDIF